jgi:hypothetical protein
MVQRERIDFRVREKGYPRSRMCGESEEQYLGRVQRDEAVRRGISIPGTVFVRRRDGVVRELSRFYDDMMFTYDGARAERVLANVHFECAKHEVRVYALQGITDALRRDARALSLLPGESSDDSELSMFGDEDFVDEGQPGWLDSVVQKVCLYRFDFC